MATVRRRLENPIRLFGSYPFEVPVIKKMTTLSCLDDCKKPLFQWRIKEQLTGREHESRTFCFNHRRRLGKLRLKFRNSSDWELTVTFDVDDRLKPWTPDPDEKYASASGRDNTTFFLIKCTYDFGFGPSAVETDFCRQIITFGGGAISRHYLRSTSKTDHRVVRSLLVEVFHVPAAIPNYFLAPKGNMIVGKIAEFSRARFGNEYPGLNEQPRFLFGSAKTGMTVRFTPHQISFEEGCFGLKARLKLIYDGEIFTRSIRNEITFTLFSERKEEIDDFVHTSVIVREKEVFEYEIILASFRDLDKMIAEDNLYYKIVLELIKDT